MFQRMENYDLAVNPNSLVDLVPVQSDGSGAACPHHISLRDVFSYLLESYKKVGPISFYSMLHWRSLVGAL